MTPKPSFTDGSVAAAQEMGTTPPPAKVPADGTSGSLWGTILAGGHGRRVQRFMRRLNGSDLPKQFCAVIGRRSMLQHTLDRAAVGPLVRLGGRKADCRDPGTDRQDGRTVAAA